MTEQKSRSTDLSSQSDAQSGTSGGNLARDIGSRDEEQTATSGDPELTRYEAGRDAARHRNHVRQ
jgi:hypothetical protein